MALAQLREAEGKTQAELARSLKVSQPNISQLEHKGDLYVSTLRDYVEALGGRLEIRAVFPDRTVNLSVAVSERREEDETVEGLQ